MQIQKILKEKLEAHFNPAHIELVNESHMHNVPANSETHFKLLMVSEKFNGQSRVQRQRAVNEVIKEELAGPVHAFSQRLLTPEEWQGQNATTSFQSPDCKGGSKL